MLSVDDTWNYLMLPGFLPAEGVLDAFGVVPIALGGGGGWGTVWWCGGYELRNVVDQTVDIFC